MARIVELWPLQGLKPEGDELRGPCPLHGSESPHSRVFAVNLRKNAYRCFKCGAKGNQLDLWAAVSGKPLYQSTLELCKRAGVVPPRRQ